MITVSYNAYCAISKEGDNDIWMVRPRVVVPLLPLCSQIDVGATMNALLGDTFSRENNTHGSRFHDRDPQFASRILGAMTQSCYIGTRDIRSRVIRGPYCIFISHWFDVCQWFNISKNNVIMKWTTRFTSFNGWIPLKYGSTTTPPIIAHGQNLRCQGSNFTLQSPKTSNIRRIPSFDLLPDEFSKRVSIIILETRR